MISGSINITSRPIKIGFLVDYQDKKALKKAIRINSFLWGGAYNPIIPVYQRLPRLFEGEPIKPSIGGLDLTKGYIEAFDADYYINYSSASPTDLMLPNDRIVADTLVMAPSKNARANYGVALPEVLNHLRSTEFKYQRRDDPLIYDVNFGPRYELFLGSVFGMLEPTIYEKVEKGYTTALGMKKVTANLSNFTDYIRKDALFLRRFSQLYLNALRKHGLDRDCLFFMDATSWQDIVDYINLRAVGRNVIPIVKQTASEPNVIKFVQQFAKDSFRPLPNNPNGVYLNATIICGRGCSFEEAEQFAKSLNLPPTKNNQPYLALQRWYPRIWDRWARSRDSVEGCTLEHERRREAINSDEVEIACLAPDWVDLVRVSGYPRYANDITFDTYIAPRYFAEVLPSMIPNAARLLGTIDFSNWRFSRNGATYTTYMDERTIHIKLPEGGAIYDAWAEAQGLKVSPSVPGKTANTIVSRLGGPHNLRILANRALLQKIQEQANGPDAPRPLTHSQLVSLFAQMRRELGIEGRADVFIHRLIEASIIELGADVTCPSCGKTRWHRLNALDSKLTCPVCMDEFAVNGGEPNKTFTWSYSLVGPFRLPKMADGAYTVVLSLHFFTDLYKSTITPQYSFESADGSFEADFGILLKQHFESDTDVLPIFGECKSFKDLFLPKDINKMMKLSELVPGSVLVFSTLRNELTATEKRLLSQRVEQMRQKRLKGKPYSQIMILTGNELFGNLSLAYTWKTLGGDHAKYERTAHSHNIDYLCNATQELYLGIEPWDDVMMRSFEETRKKREALQAAAAKS